MGASSASPQNPWQLAMRMVFIVAVRRRQLYYIRQSPATAGSGREMDSRGGAASGRDPGSVRLQPAAPSPRLSRVLPPPRFEREPSDGHGVPVAIGVIGVPEPVDRHRRARQLPRLA